MRRVLGWTLALVVALLSPVAPWLTAAGVVARVEAGSVEGSDEGSDEGADAEDVLTVTAELSAEYDLGDRLTVRVTVAADRLIDGAVVVRVGSGLTIRRDVQVAGGSTEEIRLVVPSSELNGNDLRIELVDGDDSNAADPIDIDELRFTHDSATDVAGILPRLIASGGDPPARATLPGDLRRVNLVALPVALLDAGAGSIDQLDAVAATSADLAQLDDGARHTLFVWVERGGQLVLDDDDDVEALPESWRPGADGHALAGRGEVRLVDGLLSSGDWGDALAPATLGVGDSPTGFVGVDMLVDPRLTLSQRAGVQLPELGTIIAVLAGYVLLVGPVMYLVLRRARRLTAAWVAIPAVALLVGTGVVLTGSGWRSSGRPTANVVAESSLVGTDTVVDALVFRRSGGTASVALPDGWSAAGRSQFGWFGDTSSTSTVVSGSGDRIETQLEAGQIAVLGVQGSDDATLLAVDAVARDDRITGTVTNTTAVMLHSVAVFAAGRAVLVGELEAAGSASFTIESPVDRPDPYSSAIGTVWPQAASMFSTGTFDAGPTDDGVDLGVWTSFASRAAADLYPAGSVRAAGWTDELASPTGDSFAATTLVTSLAPITAAEGHGVPAPTVRWGWITTPFDPNNGALQSPVLRYVVPTGAPVDALSFSLPNGVSAIAVLADDGTWTKLRATPADGDGDDVAVPAERVYRGAVVVRLTLDPNMGIDPAQVAPVLRGSA